MIREIAAHRLEEIQKDSPPNTKGSRSPQANCQSRARCRFSPRSRLAMSDKLSVHFWGMSANAEGQLAIGAIIVIVIVMALVMLVRRRV